MAERRSSTVRESDAVPSGVADTLRTMRPDIDFEHVSTWHEGAYINAPDDLLLKACWERSQRRRIALHEAVNVRWDSTRATSLHS